jgi:hypothetical protein
MPRMVKRLLQMHDRRLALNDDIIIRMFHAQAGRCALTGVPMTTVCWGGYVATNLSIDRIDSDRGYTEDNIQLVCVAANKMKRDTDQSEFIRWCRMIADHADRQRKDIAA